MPGGSFEGREYNEKGAKDGKDLLFFFVSFAPFAPSRRMRSR
jgi:hypothetical protein